MNLVAEDSRLWCLLEEDHREYMADTQPVGVKPTSGGREDTPSPIVYVRFKR